MIFPLILQMNADLEIRQTLDLDFTEGRKGRREEDSPLITRIDAD